MGEPLGQISGSFQMSLQKRLFPAVPCMLFHRHMRHVTGDVDDHTLLKLCTIYVVLFLLGCIIPVAEWPIVVKLSRG